VSVTEKTYIDKRIDESSKHNEDKSINISFVPSGKSRDRGVGARPAVPANGNFCFYDPMAERILVCRDAKGNA